MIRLERAWQSDEFKSGSNNALLPIGLDVKWNTVFQDLTVDPNILLGGMTGTGKSNFFHCAIQSLLKSIGVEGLKFILIDSKRVELPTYNQLPNLVFPVIVDEKEARKAFEWCYGEIDRRAKIRQENKAENAGATQIDPRIVIIIDECSDLMVADLNFYESAIRHIIDAGRENNFGIMIGTSRPSPVDVYPQTLVESFSRRIAFQTATAADAKVILGIEGAEKMLGNGDMLYFDADADGPVRLQGFFVSEEDIKKSIKTAAGK